MLGIYANFTADPSIVLDGAIEAPRTPGVRFNSVTTISLSGGKETIAHLVNDVDGADSPGSVRHTIPHYPRPAISLKAAVTETAPDRCPESDNWAA